MKVIFVKNYRKKILFAAAMVVFWLLMLALAGIISTNRLSFNVTVNDFLTFSHPASFRINDVYVSDKADGSILETCFPSVKAKKYNVKTFDIENVKFSFSYPSAFSFSPESFPGSEILYHIGFNDKENVVQGFVQAWKLTGSLEAFLKKSRENSTLEFGYFNESPVTVNNMPGYIWDYTVKTNQGMIKGMEAFLSKGDLMFRISYFLPESAMNEEHKKNFLEMVKSVNAK